MAKLQQNLQGIKKEKKQLQQELDELKQGTSFLLSHHLTSRKIDSSSTVPVVWSAAASPGTECTCCVSFCHFLYFIVPGLAACMQLTSLHLGRIWGW